MTINNYYYDSDGSFNRYMVECEYSSIMPRSWSVKVLIDTWWNVNHS